jgi:hypothetical protein
MTVTDATGRTWKISRRMNLIAWAPRWRGDITADLPTDLDFGLDDGIAMTIGAILLFILVAIIVLPVMIFVTELALVFALIPAVLLGLIVVGVRRHSVVAVCADDAGQPAHTKHDVRFLWQSRRIIRQWADQLRATGSIS